MLSSADMTSFPSLGCFAAHSSRCFTPNAVFQLADGNWCTASDLRRGGGEVLQGPDGTHVRVMETRRHQAEPRIFFKLHTSRSMLEVTQDHRITGQWPRGSQMTVAAEEMQPCILTGAGWEPVERFERETKTSVVIEPIFENDAPVLVWTRSGRKFKDATPEQAFVVRGGLCDVYNLYEVKNGFIDNLVVPQSTSMSRSRSADSQLAPSDRRRLARARSSKLSRPFAI